MILESYYYEKSLLRWLFKKEWIKFLIIFLGCILWVSAFTHPDYFQQHSRRRKSIIYFLYYGIAGLKYFSIYKLLGAFILACLIILVMFIFLNESQRKLKMVVLLEFLPENNQVRIVTKTYLGNSQEVIIPKFKIKVRKGLIKDPVFPREYEGVVVIYNKRCVGNILKLNHFWNNQELKRFFEEYKNL